MSAPAISVETIEKLAGNEPSGDTRSFARLSAYDDAAPDSIIFAQDDDALAKALTSDAGLILAPLNAANDDARLLRVKHPKHVFALCGQWFDSFQAGEVHPHATVEGSIGAGTSVGAGSTIAKGARIGEHCRIDANVTIYGCVTLGDRVVVQAGAVLGAMGFGYVRGADGTHVRFPQQGSLAIEDDVEIGANTTIDRGALGETRIGSGTKIDNLVHIGHNCVVGKNVVIAAQVGISGSTTIGDGAVLAGQVGLGDHVNIGPGVILGGQGGVFPGKTVSGPGELFAGTPAEPVKDYLRGLAKLRRLK
jgi:UDP-3-O-[3-hydroxymyristoyl] glucosamine N-acyltransferase